MSAIPDRTSVPRIEARFRLQHEPAQNAWVMLYPEGMVRLNDSAAAILQRCDGQRDVGAIIADIEKTFEQRDLERDVLGFLEVAHQQGWVSF